MHNSQNAQIKKQLRIGLLPSYLELYDDLFPENRALFDDYLQRITAAFEERNFHVCTAAVSRISTEFQAAVNQFESEEVDCIVTIHLAYSPSLEAIDIFCKTQLPIILFDTSMDADFGPTVSAQRIMFNHGVHGVMDFASMLRRRRRSFQIVAGHDSDPHTINRIAELVRASASAQALRKISVLRIGKIFPGMGDFSVDEKVLQDQLGINVRQVGIETLDAAVANVSDKDIIREMAQDHTRFTCEVDEQTHKRSVRVGLGLRELLKESDHHAMTVNFQAFDSDQRPADTMPFLEISKAMARSIGYAGEGDALTAAMVGALAKGFDAVTFTEIFCADWAGGNLFLSHMGEISPSVAGDKPRLVEKPFPFTDAHNPAILTCALKPGPAVLVNLAPGPDNTFTLIIAPMQVLAEDPHMDPAMRDVIRAWVRPACKLELFLEAYSHAGGTHHKALVLGEHANALAAFGRMSNMNVVCIDSTYSVNND
ncbi:MAG: hypothetical protein JKX85_12305 [Phycisphaeraceae bacterium]|nr:hypothetical protein [Phycisphaeraceae bacterium]